MGGDYGDRRSTGAEGMDHDLRQAISKLVHDFSRASGSWKDSDYYEWEEIPGRVTGVSYRTYLDENGISRRLIVISETYYYLST